MGLFFNVLFLNKSSLNAIDSRIVLAYRVAFSTWISSVQFLLARAICTPLTISLTCLFCIGLYFNAVFANQKHDINNRTGLPYTVAFSIFVWFQKQSLLYNEIYTSLTITLAYLMQSSSRLIYAASFGFLIFLKSSLVIIWTQSHRE